MRRTASERDRPAGPVGGLEGARARNYLECEGESRVTRLHPVLQARIGESEGLTVLDFGCGDAVLAAELAGRGARHVLAVDSSETMVRSAEARRKRLDPEHRARLEVRRGDEASLGAFGVFDLVVCSLVLMMLPERRRFEAAVEGLVGRLAADGRLLLAVTHPCFRSAEHSTFRNELPEGFGYWDSGRPYSVQLRESSDDAAEVVFTDYHWTLGDLAGALRRSGAAIVDLQEIGTVPTGDGRFADDPAYLVVEARHA